MTTRTERMAKGLVIVVPGYVLLGALGPDATEIQVVEDIVVFVLAVALTLLWMYALFRWFAILSRRWGYVDEKGKPIGVAVRVPSIRGEVRAEQMIIRLLRPAVPFCIGCVYVVTALQLVIVLL